MKKLIFITIVIAVFLFFLTACGLIEFNYKRTIWINPDVECCGVKDPLNSLEWLKELYKLYKDSYFSTATGLKEPEFIFLFQNDITQENFVVIDLKGEYSSWITIYNCSGDQIDGGVYDYHWNKNLENTFFSNTSANPPAPCSICDEFFKTHTLIDTIAYFIVEPKNKIL